MTQDAPEPVSDRPVGPSWLFHAFLHCRRRWRLWAMERHIAALQNPRPWGGYSSDNPGFFFGEGGGGGGGGDGGG